MGGEHAKSPVEGPVDLGDVRPAQSSRLNATIRHKSVYVNVGVGNRRSASYPVYEDVDPLPKEPRAMKRFIGLFAATVAAIVPLSVAAARPATTRPADYQPGCESAYQAGKPIFDPLIAGGKAVTGPLEKGMCGENRHS
jgi:hypothetical protein